MLSEDSHESLRFVVDHENWMRSPPEAERWILIGTTDDHSTHRAFVLRDIKFQTMLASAARTQTLTHVHNITKNADLINERHPNK